MSEDTANLVARVGSVTAVGELISTGTSTSELVGSAIAIAAFTTTGVSSSLIEPANQETDFSELEKQILKGLDDHE